MANYAGLAADVEALAARGGHVIDAEVVEPEEAPSGCQLSEYTDGSGFCIDCSSALVGQARDEAIAHEHGHLRLMYDRMILHIPSDGPDMPPYLAAQIGNAVSHAAVIALLETEYGIGSSAHFDACNAALVTARSKAVDPSVGLVELVGIGVFLFDAAANVPGARDSARQTAALNPAIDTAFVAAGTSLSLIAPGVPIPEQVAAVDSFMRTAVAGGTTSAK